MKRTTVIVNKHRIELSNLDKVLFADAQIIKAEIIEYYLKAAPTILRHIKGRPLSFVRYPEGIEAQAFFQKNRPDWAPDWVEHALLGDENRIDYVLASKEADLVWLANLACIEFHQMPCRSPHFQQPDYLAFDLDPPERYEFKRVVEIALELKEYLEGFGYHAFVKTSGGKGVHILAPIEPGSRIEAVARTAQEIAQRFVDGHRESTTLHVKKEARQGKLLVDIYRNRAYQTIVSPYSLRGRPGAPVSMPLTWEQVASLDDPAEYNLRTALDHLHKGGDAWEGMAAYAVKLHTERKAGAATGSARRASHPRVADSLAAYAGKRHFTRSPEPGPDPSVSGGNAFVVHRHHASRLHYDLRLERDGVLKSWAVPKGLPPRPGTKRLAVAVEDHPVSYLKFEGTIPKGEYGAGPVWVFAGGRYEVTKEKKDSFHFRLHSRPVDAEYRLIHTRDKDWLLERIDALQVDWLRDPVEPMLAQTGDRPLSSGDYLYEIKWDGIRALIALEEGKITIRSRSGRDITGQFPELQEPHDSFRAACGLFDAEIVCLDGTGKPVFQDAAARLQQAGSSGVARARARQPATCYVFDCLYLDGCSLVSEPLERRRAWMADSLRPDRYYRVSEAFDEGIHLYDAAAQMGLEGILAKRRDSPYLPGKRSAHWLKIKAHQSIECIIIGCTTGKGARESNFGALHLGRGHGTEMQYLGKVGTGFDDRLLESINGELRKMPKSKKPFARKLPDDPQSVWFHPGLVCEVRYASRTRDGILREPVFMRLRPDLSPADVKD